MARRGSSARLRLLDLFSGAGGAAVGYARAGFDVVGVDNRPQPHYPFPFVQADALEYAAAHGREFDAIHASPPCQRYSVLLRTMEDRRQKHVDLVPTTRAVLLATGRPYVMENVYGAALARGAVMLCGAMFGLRTYRHRWFESPALFLTPYHRKHRIRSERGKRRKEYFLSGGFISVVGNVGRYPGPDAMGIDWMTGKELSQAIPPAYTEWVGRELRERLERQAE